MGSSTGSSQYILPSLSEGVISGSIGVSSDIIKDKIKRRNQDDEGDVYYIDGKKYYRK